MTVEQAFQVNPDTASTSQLWEALKLLGGRKLYFRRNHIERDYLPLCHEINLHLHPIAEALLYRPAYVEQNQRRTGNRVKAVQFKASDN